MTNPRNVLTFLIAVFVAVQVTTAQRAPGDVGIGAQAGSPNGLTLKFYNPGTSAEVLASWDFDNYFFVDLHGIFDKHLNDAGSIHLFYGPGAFIEINDRGADDNIEVGISGRIGLDLILGSFELFLQVTPRLELIESTDFDAGGGIGFRVYF